MHWYKESSLTEDVRTHHGCLVLVDHHFFSFRNYAGARDKTKNSKAAGTLMSSCLRALGGSQGWTFNKVQCGMWAKNSPPQQSGVHGALDREGDEGKSGCLWWLNPG